MEDSGLRWFRGGLSEDALRSLESLAPRRGAPGIRFDPAALGAARAELNQIADCIVPGAKAVRVTAFDKSNDANWSLGWHQDRVIAVRDRVETPGFSGWSRKADIWHVEPPIQIIEEMFFLRVHLDPADESNGALVVAPGSHLRGRVMSKDTETIALLCGSEVCVADRGDVLAAHALLLHRSGRSQIQAPRRTVRIDYTAAELPAPLQWAN